MKKIINTLLIGSVVASSLIGKENGITVYSATKSNQSINDLSANVEVITKSELESKHITNITEALNLVNGVSVVRSGGIGQNTSIKIRGMHQTNTLVLIDGIRYNDPTNPNGVSFEYLDIAEVERIEIIKGAQSGIWGADASGGVINIITRDTNQLGFRGKIGVEYGSFNTRKSTLSLSQNNKDSYIKLAYNKTKTDGFSAQTKEGTQLKDLEDDRFENTTYSFDMGGKLSNQDKVDLSFKRIDSLGEFDGYLAPNDTTQNYDSSTIIKGINYNHKTDHYSLDLYTNKTTFDRKYPNGWTPIFSGSSSQIGFKSKIEYRKKDFIIVGVEQLKSKDLISNKSYTNDGLFVSNSNSFKDTIITQSIRQDKFDSFNDKTTGKFGIKHQIIKDLSVRGNYGTAYKAPTLTQLFDTTYGNKNLQAEETKAYDIGFLYKDLILSYFENRVENLISFHPTTYQNINVDGESKIKGYEIGYKKGFNKLIFSFNYQFVDAKDKDGHILGRVAKEEGKVSVDYFGIKKLNINLNAQYIGERWDRNYSIWNTPTNNGEQTGKYTIFNGVIDYRYTKNINLYLKIDNIGDKEYVNVDGYSTSPRAYYVGLNAKF